VTILVGFCATVNPEAPFGLEPLVPELNKAKF